MLNKCFSTLLSITFFCSTVFGQDYPYPYKNPDMASLTTNIMKSVHEDPFNKVAKILEVEVIKDRNKTFLLENQSKFRFSFYPQKKDAPLIFMLADMSGSHVSGYMAQMADLFHSAGYNVVGISSPFFWNFVVSSSQSAIPGLTSEDAADMYQTLQLVLEKIDRLHGPQFTKKAVVGFGFGGLLAAHLSSIENKERRLGIDQYLLINPVVNIMHAITEIETRTAIALELGMPRVEGIKMQAFGFVVENMGRENKVTDPKHFLNLDKKFVLKSPKEYKFLSGAIMRMNIGDTVFVSQQINDLGVLKQKVYRNLRYGRQKEADDLGLVGYVKQIFVPFFSKKYPKLLDILKQSNFNFVREDIKNNPNVFIMHNADDFLIDEGQLEYLSNLVGPERIKIYPLGGHLGNLWFKQNQADILNRLSILK